MKRLFDKPEYKWIYYAHASHPKYLRKEVHEWNEKRWNEYAELLSSPKCIAVGETGLDYSYSSFCLEHQKLQKKFFEIFIDSKYEKCYSMNRIWTRFKECCYQHSCHY